MKKLKMGMVGGGIGSFIGSIHRNAAFLDNGIELVCGSFSSDYNNSLETGRNLYLDQKRIYKSYIDLINSESELSEEERMDFIAIVTPNHLHFDPAIKALEKDFR